MEKVRKTNKGSLNFMKFQGQKRYGLLSSSLLQLVLRELNSRL
ncbi:hypothetical protein SVIOM342S_06174 [Streptomyces violaceorubidus]